MLQHFSLAREAFPELFEYTNLSGRHLVIPLRGNHCWSSKATAKTVVQRGSRHEPNFVTSSTKNRFYVAALKAGSLMTNDGPPRSPSGFGCILLQFNFNHGVSSFVFVVGERWPDGFFVTATVQDVKTVNCMKSLSSCPVVRRNKKEKSLEIICGW